MRTHARYELQDSTSLEEAPPPVPSGPDLEYSITSLSGPVHGPGPGRLTGMGSRYSQPVSCESVNLPHTLSRPPSLMETGEEGGGRPPDREVEEYYEQRPTT
jgi:hypothetical protein